MKLLLLLVLAAISVKASQRILLGYFDNWSPAYTVADLEKSGAAKHLTHIAYAFATIHSGACALSNPQLDRLNFAALNVLRERHKQLKLLISLGGANATNAAAFAAAAKSREGRAKLAASCIDLFLKGRLAFDGIDLDWEFPAAQDKTNFTALVAEFREQMDATHQHYLLTIAAPAGKQNYSNMELAKIGGRLDFLNVMTYDYSGNWSKQTGHAASLSSVSATIRGYREAGVPPSKMVVGIPFFGHGWTGVPPVNHGLFQTSVHPAPTPPGDVLDRAGHASFRALNRLPGFGSFNDKSAGAHWIFNVHTGTFWSFDDQKLILDKVKFVKSSGLAGAMVWDLKDDTPNASLTKAMAAALRR